MQRDYRLTVTRNDMLSRVTIREGHFKDHPSLLMRDTYLTVRTFAVSIFIVEIRTESARLKHTAERKNVTRPIHMVRFSSSSACKDLRFCTQLLITLP